MTQQELADAAGVRQPLIHKIEAGERRGSARTRRAIAAALDVPELLAFPAPILGEDELETVA